MGSQTHRFKISEEAFFSTAQTKIVKVYPKKPIVRGDLVIIYASSPHKIIATVKTLAASYLEDGGIILELSDVVVLPIAR